MTSIDTNVRLDDSHQYLSLVFYSDLTCLQGMALSYVEKGAGATKHVKVPFDPPLSGYDEVKPRLLAMKVDAEEALGMVRCTYFILGTPRTDTWNGDPACPNRDL